MSDPRDRQSNVSRKRKRGGAKSVAEVSEVDGVPEEALAEGSGPVQAICRVGIDAIASDPETDGAAIDLEPHPGDEPGEAEPVRDAELGEPAADDPAAVLPTSAAALEPAQLKQLVEALVFASDKPITILRLRQLTRVSDTARLADALAELAEDYAERGLILQQVSGGYQFRTRTQWSAWVQQLIAGRPVRLTRAQLETLAIIAYRQPITRPEIDDIRGVDSSATLKLLIERSLIRILGKKEEAGRPMLYGTTKEFLDFFSLGDLRELPTLREYSELTDESRQLITDRLGPEGEGDGGDGDGGVGGGSGEPSIEVAPEATAADLIARYVTELDVGDDAAEAIPTGGGVTDAAAAGAVATETEATHDAEDTDEMRAPVRTLDALAADMLALDALEDPTAEPPAEIEVEHHAGSLVDLDPFAAEGSGPTADAESTD